MNKLFPIGLTLFFFGCEEKESNNQVSNKEASNRWMLGASNTNEWEDGWSKSQISDFYDVCIQYGYNFYNSSQETINQNCDCITNALIKSVRLKAIEGLYKMFSEIAAADNISMSIVVSGFSELTTPSRAQKFIDNITKCCDCESGLCYDTFTSALLVINGEEYAPMSNFPSWQEIEGEIPEWCTLNRHLMGSHYFQFYDNRKRADETYINSFP